MIYKKKTDFSFVIIFQSKPPQCIFCLFFGFWRREIFLTKGESGLDCRGADLAD